MKQYITLILLALLPFMASAQTATKVLDSAAKLIESGGGVQAQFDISGGKIPATSGTIMLKGNMFHVKTPSALLWFDGKTMWTYMKANEEVNVSNPSAAQLQRINPYNFIHLYKSGYKATMETKGASRIINLKATGSKKITDMQITLGKTTNIISQIRMKQGGQWTTINIRNFRRTSLPNGTFRFNAKDYPKAEVIDLR